MKNRLISIGIVCLLVISGFLGFVTFETYVVNAGNTLYVGSGVGNDSATIQGAIDIANDGDTVFVYSGTYIENIIVDITINLTGENRDTTIIDGSESDVVHVTADWVNITGFNITNGDSGILLDLSSNNNITHNNITKNKYGLEASVSSDNYILDNNFIDNRGIAMYIRTSSTNNYIANNVLSSNFGSGIFLSSSSNFNITNNIFINCGVSLWGNLLSHYTSHNISTDNLVNEKPLFYYKNDYSLVIDGAPIGQLIIANCMDFEVKNLEIKDTDKGITVAFCKNVLITGNNVSSNNNEGIFLDSSTNCEIVGNNATSNYDGIYLHDSSVNNVTGNNMSLNMNRGLQLYQSSNNNVTGNNYSSNDMFGISMYSSINNNITDNNFINNGIYIWGGSLSYFNSHNIPTNNIVNGKPLYYYKNCSGVNIDGIPIGQLIIANCTDFEIRNLQVTNTDIGIDVVFSQNISIIGNDILSNNWFGIRHKDSTYINNTANNISNNYIGFYLYSSSNINITGNNITSNLIRGFWFDSSSSNNISGNNISDNGEGFRFSSSSNKNTITNNNIYSNSNYGIYFSSCSNNSIYHNNIIDNSIQAYDNGNDNFWNDTYPSGGNYWSHYSPTCLDLYNGSTTPQTTGSPDGICDVQFDIDGDSIDYYPLRYPWGTTPPIDTTPPEISNVLVDGLPSVSVTSGTIVTLTATIDDLTTGSSIIAGANYTIGSQNWPGTNMNPIDGTFNSKTEDVTFDVSTTGWSVGSHDLYVYGWDEQYNYNTTSTAFATITISAPADSDPPEISNVSVNGTDSITIRPGIMVTLMASIEDSATGGSNITGANYTIGSQNWPGTNINPEDGSFDSPSEVVTVSINTVGWGDDSYDLYVYAWDENNNYNIDPGTYATIIIDSTLPTSSVDTISPDWSNEGPIAITATASDIGSTVSSVKLLYRFSSDGYIWSLWDTVGIDTTDPWQWSFDFPDGDGYYEFKSQATDEATNVETDIGKDAFCGYDSVQPTANAGADQEVAQGTTVTFNSTGTTDNFQHLKYNWTFIDGTVIMLYEVNPTHRFDSSGEFLVTLNITDAAGNWNVDTMWVNVSAAVTTGSISGTVTDEDGEPISGVKVKLVDTTFSATTNENGDFTLTDMPAGTYDLSLEKTGYQDKTITGLTVTAGDDTKLTTDSLTMIKIAEEDEEDGEEENYLWVIFIVVIILVIVVLLFLLKPWKKEPVRPEEAEPVTEEETIIDEPMEVEGTEEVDENM
ncbi:MAG: right-handed parallel beta-helix repeat-containing protein [Thermoplasmata archaeon]|nr:MAG: right-handed parallel beta-helix repeat-containing protein [Thermoplasmata archaeon]